MISNTPGRCLSACVPDYCVFDLETTGCSCSCDNVIEISALKVKNHRVVDEFSFLIDPGRPIPCGATMVNGITDAMVENCPTMNQVLPLFNDFVGTMVLVGHNIGSFDMKFIHRDAKRYLGGVFGNDYIDTLPLSRKYLKNLRHHTLGDLASYYGASTEGAHRALNDCYMNQLVFEHLAQEMEQENATEKDSPNCPVCGRPMVLRSSRFGVFWGCPNFPACRGTRRYED